MIGLSLFLSIFTMFLALYGAWFGRWATNIWINFVPHVWIVPISMTIAVSSIIIVERRGCINAYHFILAIVAILIIDVTLLSTNGNEFTFFLVTNHPTLSIVALFSAWFSTARMSGGLPVKRPSWIRWWHFATCIFLGFAFRGMRGDLDPTLAWVPFDMSTRLQTLFGLVAPIVLSIIYLTQRYIAARTESNVES